MKYLNLTKGFNPFNSNKVVIRPDSGDPVKIITGNTRDEWITNENTHSIFDMEEPEYKGVIELLWDTFGGTINEKGYKVLDSHIGAIYGDSITVSRAEEICSRLESKGFASSNIVFGVGSFTYQYNTRDTYGFAMKATYGEVNGVGREIFKDPVTDSGLKKSLKGLLAVHITKDGLIAVDQQTSESEKEGELKLFYKDGEFEFLQSLNDIRIKLNLA